MNSYSKLAFLTSILHGTTPDVNDASCLPSSTTTKHDAVFLYLQTLLNINDTVADVNGVTSLEKGCTVVVSAWRTGEEEDEDDQGYTIYSGDQEKDFELVNDTGLSLRTPCLKEHALHVFRLFRLFDVLSYLQLTRFFVFRFHEEIYRRLHEWDSKFKLTPFEQLRFPAEYLSDIPPTSHRFPKAAAARFRHYGMVPNDDDYRTFKLDAATVPHWLECIAKLVMAARCLLANPPDVESLDELNSELGLLSVLLHSEAIRQLFEHSVAHAQTESTGLEIERLKSAETLWYYLHDITAWHRAVFYIKYTVPPKFFRSATGIILWNPAEEEDHDRFLALRRWIKQIIIDKLSDADKDKRRDALAWVLRRCKPCWRIHIHPGAGLLALATPGDGGGSKVEAGVREGESQRAGTSQYQLQLSVQEAISLTSSCCWTCRRLGALLEAYTTGTEFPPEPDPEQRPRYILAWTPPGPVSRIPDAVLERLTHELLDQIMDHAVEHAEAFAVHRSYWKMFKPLEYVQKAVRVS
ncbi:hypothetical protein AAF712_008367 [Marasmius tenuissimus]|uniref:Uncharacterized protein n=1 Tax=Marasmius tenuissimus TaxID=585030 RepID=A0ABR2ZU62_9AGAR